MKAVEKLTDGPLGKGSRYRGKFKGFGTIEYEFAEFDRAAPVRPPGSSSDGDVSAPVHLRAGERGDQADPGGRALAERARADRLADGEVDAGEAIPADRRGGRSVPPVEERRLTTREGARLRAGNGVRFGMNVTAVQADVSRLSELDRLYETVKKTEEEIRE